MAGPMGKGFGFKGFDVGKGGKPEFAALLCFATRSTAGEEKTDAVPKTTKFGTYRDKIVELESAEQFLFSCEKIDFDTAEKDHPRGSGGEII